MMAACLVAGCASAPPPAELPTLKDLRARQTQPDHVPAQPPAAAVKSPVLLVQRVDLPLNYATDKAWALVNPRAVSPTLGDAWRGNGIAVGLMPSKYFQAFGEAIGNPAGLRRAVLRTSPRWTPLIQAPRQPQPITADLTVLPRPPREVKLDGGRIQMLLRAEPGPLGAAIVTLCPHHHVARLTLEPRSPYEKLMDGDLLATLQLTVTLQRGQALVLGLSPPPPPPAARRTGTEDRTSITLAAPDPAAESTPNTSGDESGVFEDMDLPQSATAPDMQRLPPHLGRSLFAGLHASGPVQSIYVITLADN